MRKYNIIMVGLILLSLSQRICLGIDRLVPSQYPTIQGAINAVVSGDTVVISPGIYAGEMNSNVHVPASKPITVRSIDPTDPNVVAGTVIDCFDTVGGDNPAFLLDGGGSVVIDGLTIINGYNYQGGGVMFRNAFAILRNCVFEDCFAFGNGGTIYSENSIIVCSNCIIRNSLSDMYGGAVTSINSTFEMHGCTIEGGFARNGGGAIYAANNSKLILTDCALNDNWSENNGGALSIRNSTLSIKGGEFVGNTALGGQGRLQGGGIYVEENPSPSNNLSITDSKFIDNFASGNGGGIYCRYQPLTVARSYFIGNIAQQSGGGIYCQNGIELTESVLAGNSAAYGGTALHSYGLSQSTNSIIRNCTFSDNGTYPRSYIFVQISNGNAEIVNSIFWGTPTSGQIIFVDCGRSVFAYNDVQDGKFPCGTGVGNIQVDPMFVKPGVWQNNNYIPGDYHLKLESPCINAGDPNTVVTSGETDIEGNPRLRLGRVDMGAYELPSHPMDFDESGRVDFKDFARFAQSWLWQAQWCQ